MSSPPHEPIAVIGSGCRFPGNASSPSKLWELLHHPRDVLSKIPVSRFNTNGIYHENAMHHGSTNVRDSYLLDEDHRVFDARFFGVKPIEADSMDPQQRLMLETVYEALENAGVTIESLKGTNTAVYVGLMANEYGDLLSYDIDHLPTYFATSTAASILSNRISYFYDWHGPSVTLDTACSSSLVAVHQAVRSLRNHDCNVAVAAGANLILGPKPYITENKLNMLSYESRSRMWDEKANGYARGEGVAALILKTLSQALADGDDIECVIRETGVNQDGRSQGITMPSSAAQTALIRDTYTRAGLDCRNPADRPQFFEAHGTGTPAGDPQEAEAIHTAFFGKEFTSPDGAVSPTMYVGSIKTVIGHTEGTAGIAGMMKTFMAMRHGVVPPNMLFDKLNPAVAPFYENLQISTAPVTWPISLQEKTKRASVNSFGFGGTNAHAILEYNSDLEATASNGQTFLPLIFSAGTESSLRSLLRKYTDYLVENPRLSLRDLAYTLNFRRAAFPYRAAFSSTSIKGLIQSIEKSLDKDETIKPTLTLPKIKVIGVFTGQGAQWPTMGRELILRSSFVRSTVESLEMVLQNLPEQERPKWSLMDELLAGADQSRVQQAAISQPLCTVVQLILVDILHAAGIQFSAVVGHSSGEIAAAYAAGFISAQHALLIAYYRGVHSSKAGSSSGNTGAMLAVGTSFEDATEFCELEDMEGRVSVAACNSSSSVTISGDADAIDEALVAFQAEKKFVRKLKVDTAYHSHHMQPCTPHYVRALESSKIEILQSAGYHCSWYSSVTGKLVDASDTSLLSTYWSKNMAQPVLFHQALTAALQNETDVGVAMELGPHPALRGPALQTIQEITGDTFAYSGVLERNNNDVEALMAAIAFATLNISASDVDLKNFDKVMSGASPARLLKGLPNYAWDHDRVYWNESRLARARRTADTGVHELLGRSLVSSGSDLLQWRNILSAKEIPWLSGHRLQGQIVFPAAGYASIAIEAIMTQASGRSIRLLDLEDLVINKAMVFEDDESSAEILCSLNIIRDRSSDNFLTAHFTLQGTTNQDLDDLVTYSTAVVSLHFGDVDSTVLPPRGAELVDSVQVNHDSFYTYLGTLGYHYSDSFKVLQDMKRTTDMGSAQIQPLHGSSSLLVHPSSLDCAIQSVILAFCWPEDNRLWTLHVPTKIARMRLNPSLMATATSTHTPLDVDAVVDSTISNGVAGEVSIYGPDTSAAMIQIEGLEIIPFTKGSAETDAKLFFDMRWNVADSDGPGISKGVRATEQDRELGKSLERVAYVYLKTVCQELNEEDWANAEPHFRQMREFATDVVTRVESGTAPGCDAAWRDDTQDQVAVEVARWPGNIDLRLITAVGENLGAAIRGETMILQHMLKDNLLNDFYCQGLGLDIYTQFLSNAVQQISHRYCNMDILEIGAGTGGVTKTIIKDLGDAFRSYTYTDISSGFFEKAQEVFYDYRDRMVFRTLDAEKDPIAQNYSEASYDLIVCSLVLHATQDLEVTLANVRRLLKPGGYLALLEITDLDSFRTGFAMSALPGWWLGHADGRALNPCVPAGRWDAELRKTGFSGIKAKTQDLDALVWPFSVIVAQATDADVSRLTDPLSLSPQMQEKEIILIGGSTAATATIAGQLESLLRPWYRSVSRIDTVAQFVATVNAPLRTVLSITELDVPIFKDLTDAEWQGLRSVLDQSRNVLWVTRGGAGVDPYAVMMTGFARTLAREMPHLRMQCLDLDTEALVAPDVLAQAMLSLELSETWEQDSESKVLWSLEPEAAIHQGVMMIPRMFATKALNDRYNSTRRTIIRQADPDKNIATLRSRTSGELELVAKAKNQDHADDEHSAHLVITHSTAMALRVSSSHRLFVVAGINLDTKEQTIALSNVLASEVTVPKSWTITRSESKDKELLWLAELGWQLLARYLITQTPPGGSILVQNSPPPLIEHLSGLARADGTSFAYITTDPADFHECAVFLHQNSPNSVLRNILSPRISLFVDLAQGANFATQSLRQCLPITCVQLSASDLFASEAPARTSDVETLASNLRHAVASIIEPTVVDQTVIPVHTYSSAHPNARGLGAILSWKSSATLPVTVQPVDTKPLFRADRTYLLFGLSGQIGRSLALWMTACGARYIVLTSRNPVTDEKWLQKVQRCGAEVKLVANDITDRQAVIELVQEVQRTLPPIGGVANGAMVLQDTAIPQMDLETLKKVLRPKVEGTTILDDLFQDHSLDFFIVFSSIAWVYGQHGQSNYTAANAYLNGLIHRRRKNGLPGSVMAIGAVLGIGYIAREVDRTTYQRIQQNGYRLMSERDLHQLFAEAVVSSAGGIEGRSDAYEIITGIREMKEGEERTLTNPIFQHVITRQRAGISSAQQAISKVPLKMQLADSASIQEAADKIRDAFREKLQSILQLDKLPELEFGPDDLGMDSLIAVEIRNWFMKEVNVDMPVLKILGGATVSTMIEFAVEKLPGNLTPKIIQDHATTQVPSSHGSSTPSMSSQDGKTISTDLSTPAEPSTSDPRKADAPRMTLMSHGQARFWFLRRLLEDPTAFNITFSAKLRGNLDLVQLSTAVKTVLNRHDALKTKFYDDLNGLPIQEVMDQPVFELTIKHVTTLDETRAEFDRLKNHVYDLASGDLMQITLLQQNPTTAYLVLGYHHINMDAMSLQVLLTDIDAAYSGSYQISEVLQYPAFSMRQRQALDSGEWDRDLGYWRDEFPDFPAPLPILPFAAANTRQVQKQYRHSKVYRKVSAETGQKIASMCAKWKISAFHVHMAVFKILLARSLDIDDVAVGMADANRTDVDQLTAVGLYLNLLPLRFSYHPGESFVNVTKEVQSKVRKALAHSRVPFDVLLEQLNPERSMTYSPMFQAFIDYKPPSTDRSRILDCEVADQEYEVGQTAYDITLSITDEPGSTAEIIFQLQESLYSVQDAGVVLDMYMWLLEHFLSEPEALVGNAPLLSPAAVEEVSRVGEGDSLESRWPAPISAQVQQMITLHANRPAAIVSGIAYSYRALNSRVNTLIGRMAEIGVLPGSVVGVHVQPSIEWLTSIIAVLRVGALYMPLDTRAPMARLVTMVKESEASVVLVHAATLRNGRALSSRQTKILDVTKSSLVKKRTDKTTPSSGAGSDRSSLLFTSGTTGKPKGLYLLNDAVSNAIESASRACNIGPESRMLQQSAVSFDLSLFQSLMTLASGACLVIATQEERTSPDLIVNLMISQQVTMTTATPSEYHWWIQTCGHHAFDKVPLRTVITGGEKVTPRLLLSFKHLNKPSLHHIDVYGPAEATFFSNFGSVNFADEKAELTVGRAVPNAAVYVVDDALHLLPLGFPGEILIGGLGVNGGYLNDANNREKLVRNPFASAKFLSNGWSKAYRTGDKGRMLSDGTLMVEGRISGDTQIKLRGVRMELQDIEANLIEAAKGVLIEVAVSVRGDPAFLVAHVVFATDQAPDHVDQYLEGLLHMLSLPIYMRPSLIVPLERLPVNQNFKLDRKALAQLPLPKLSDTRNEDLSDLQRQMKDIWEKILPKSAIAAHAVAPSSDFFHVGGSSMLLAQLQKHIAQSLNINIPLIRFFERSTLADMANLVKSELSGDLSSTMIDWESETALTLDNTIPTSLRTDAKREKTKTVLLTGATGFLGKHLLRRLVKDPAIEVIHCLAVRKRHLEDQSWLPESTKIRLHEGDLVQPNLGLDAASLSSLFSQSDAIIHNAADVSFMKSYQSLRPINVVATKTLANLAHIYGIAFHYVSTSGVAHLSLLPEFHEVSAASYSPPPDGSDGYVASKWASEVYLEKLNAATGLPIWIHRPSSIMGDDAAPTDLMGSLFTYSLKLGAVPVLKGLTSAETGGYADLIDVNTVADGILEHLERSQDQSRDLRFVHHSGDMVIPMQALLGGDDDDGEEQGLGLESMPMQQWVAAAKAAGMNDLVAELLLGAEDGLEKQSQDVVGFMLYPKLLRQQSMQP